MANKTVIELDLDTEKGSRKLDNFEKTISSKGKKAGDQLEDGFFKRTLKGFSLINVAAVAAGAAIAGIFAARKFVDAANKQEDAVNKLNASLARIGEFSSESSRSLQDFASEIQRTTVFGDEAIISQLALAQGFGATAAQSKEIVAAATDLSAALGIDLTAATRNIAKTLGGLTGELGEVIPELKSFTAEQLKSGAAIDIIREKFRGLAQSEIRTFSGATAQLSNSFGDLQEQLGFIITRNPLLIQVINSLRNGFDQLGSFIERNREAIIGFINQGIGVLVGTLIVLGNTIQAVGTTLIRGLGLDRILEGFSNVSQGASIFGLTLDQFLGQSVRQISLLFQTFFNAVITGFNAVRSVALAASSGLNEVFKGLGLDLGITEGIAGQLAISEQNFNEFSAKTRESLAAVFGDGELATNVGGFTEEVRLLFENLRAGIVNQETGKTLFEELLSPLSPENLELARTSFQNFINSLKGSAGDGEEKIDEFSKSVKKSLQDGIGRSAANAFAAFGGAVASGQNALGAFGTAALQTFGQVLGQIGQGFILEGIAREVSVPGTGTALIAAGAALSTFGGLLSNVGGASVRGGGATNPTGADSTATTPTSDFNTDQDLREQGPNVSVVVQGDILDNGEDTARRIATLLSDSFDSQGLVVRGR